MPRGIWGDGTFLYVSDNQTIRRVEIGTGFVNTIAGAPYILNYADGKGSEARLNNPGPLWGDGTNLYVADTRLIRKVALATREVTTIAGDPLSYGIDDGIGANARFMDLRGISGDGRYLYVTESNSNRVRRIAIDSGEVTTVAGEFGKRGSEDGIGSAAHFTAPAGIWSDGKNIYESEVATIRKLAPVSAATPVSNLVWELISPASARFRSIYQAVESKFGG